jgi:citrate lyase subunit beta/citryl-CoA lyase
MQEWILMSRSAHSEHEEAAPYVRSALFVPANREGMLDKASKSGADVVVADLEDSVPAIEKKLARKSMGHWLERLETDDPAVIVRVNGLPEGLLEADLMACMHPKVVAVMLPKLLGPGEVRETANALDRIEAATGRRQQLFIWPIIETAAAVRSAFEIASSHFRVRYMGGSAGDEGDLAQSVGFRWTPTFRETYYLRAKVLIDARAAGIDNPMTGVVTNISDTVEVESFAVESRDLGYTGMMVIHPAHIPIVNNVFGVSPERIAWARGVIDALKQAEASGIGAIAYRGVMIDVAMGVTARRVLEMASKA